MFNTWEIIILIALVSFCLIFRKNQLGLLGTFIFVFYSGMMAMTAYKSGHISSFGLAPWSVYLYIFCGLTVVGSVMIAWHEKDKVNSKQETIECVHSSQIIVTTPPEARKPLRVVVVWGYDFTGRFNGINVCFRPKADIRLRRVQQKVTLSFLS